MATRVNGTTKADYPSEYSHTNVTPYYYYTVSETATTYSLTLYCGVKLQYVNHGKITSNVKMVMSGTGQTSKTSTKEFSSQPAGDVTVISSFTWLWSKTHTSQSKTVSANWTSMHYGAVTNSAGAASKTFTIGAKSSYAISYNANGGSGAPDGQTKWYGETLTLSSSKPTKTGHTFLGWSTSSTATSATYSAGGSYTANSAATLYAVWKADTAPFKYDANGGSGAPADQTRSYGQTLKLSTTSPTKAGYNFLGWATSTANAATGTAAYQPGDTYPAVSDTNTITLYATWELAYTKPTIDGNSLSIERCKSDGTADDEGKYAKVKFNWGVYRAAGAQYYGGSGEPYANNGANATITVEIPSDDPLVEVFALTFSGGQPVPFEGVIGTGETNPFGTDTQYPFTITVEDTQNVKTPHSVTMTGTLSTTSFPIDFNADATAMGIFRPAPDDKEGIFLGKDLYMPSELNLVDFFYPVGSYYETSDTTFNPNTAWGGTWVLETEGQVHVSGGANYTVNHADDNNGVGTQDGGSKNIQEHHHGFTNPSVTGGGVTNGITGGTHKHDLNLHSNSGSGSAYVLAVTSTAVKYTKDRARMYDEDHTHSLPSHSHTVSGGAVGSVAGATAGLPESSSEGNMQPYIIVNRWHRTA